MRILVALVLSAALIWLHPTEAPVNNLGHKAVVAKPAGQVHQEVTAPAQVAKQVETPAPQEPVVQPVAKECDKYRDLFSQYDWDVNTALAICQAESSGIPDNVSPPNWDGSRDYGLMQLNQIPILDPAANIEYAYYHKYKTPQGWNHWTVYKTGKYLNYL